MMNTQQDLGEIFFDDGNPSFKPDLRRHEEQEMANLGAVRGSANESQQPSASSATLSTVSARIGGQEVKLTSDSTLFSLSLALFGSSASIAGIVPVALSSSSASSSSYSSSTIVCNVSSSASSASLSVVHHVPCVAPASGSLAAASLTSAQIQAPTKKDDAMHAMQSSAVLTVDEDDEKKFQADLPQALNGTHALGASGYLIKLCEAKNITLQQKISILGSPCLGQTNFGHNLFTLIAESEDESILQKVTPTCLKVLEAASKDAKLSKEIVNFFLYRPHSFINYVSRSFNPVIITFTKVICDFQKRNSHLVTQCFETFFSILKNLVLETSNTNQSATSITASNSSAPVSSSSLSSSKAIETKDAVLSSPLEIKGSTASTVIKANVPGLISLLRVMGDMEPINLGMVIGKKYSPDALELYLNFINLLYVHKVLTSKEVLEIFSFRSNNQYLHDQCLYDIIFMHHHYLLAAYHKLVFSCFTDLIRNHTNIPEYVVASLLAGAVAEVDELFLELAKSSLMEIEQIKFIQLMRQGINRLNFYSEYQVSTILLCQKQSDPRFQFVIVQALFTCPGLLNNRQNVQQFLELVLFLLENNTISAFQVVEAFLANNLMFNLAHVLFSERNGANRDVSRIFELLLNHLRSANLPNRYLFSLYDQYIRGYKLINNIDCNFANLLYFSSSTFWLNSDFMRLWPEIPLSYHLSLMLQSAKINNQMRQNYLYAIARSGNDDELLASLDGLGYLCNQANCAAILLSKLMMRVVDIIGDRFNYFQTVVFQREYTRKTEEILKKFFKFISMLPKLGNWESTFDYRVQRYCHNPRFDIVPSDNCSFEMYLRDVIHRGMVFFLAMYHGRIYIGGYNYKEAVLDYIYFKYPYIDTQVKLLPIILDKTTLLGSFFEKDRGFTHTDICTGTYKTCVDRIIYLNCLIRLGYTKADKDYTNVSLEHKEQADNITKIISKCIFSKVTRSMDRGDEKQEKGKKLESFGTDNFILLPLTNASAIRLPTRKLAAVKNKAQFVVNITKIIQEICGPLFCHDIELSSIAQVQEEKGAEDEKAEKKEEKKEDRKCEKKAEEKKEVKPEAKKEEKKTDEKKEEKKAEEKKEIKHEEQKEERKEEKKVEEQKEEIKTDIKNTASSSNSTSSADESVSLFLIGSDSTGELSFPQIIEEVKSIPLEKKELTPEFESNFCQKAMHRHFQFTPLGEERKWHYVLLEANIKITILSGYPPYLIIKALTMQSSKLQYRGVNSLDLLYEVVYSEDPSLSVLCPSSSVLLRKALLDNFYKLLFSGAREIQGASKLASSFANALLHRTPIIIGSCAVNNVLGKRNKHFGLSIIHQLPNDKFFSLFEELLVCQGNANIIKQLLKGYYLLYPYTNLSPKMDKIDFVKYLNLLSALVKRKVFSAFEMLQLLAYSGGFSHVKPHTVFYEDRMLIQTRYFDLVYECVSELLNLQFPLHIIATYLSRAIKISPELMDYLFTNIKLSPAVKYDFYKLMLMGLPHTRNFYFCKKVSFSNLLKESQKFSDEYAFIMLQSLLYSGRCIPGNLIITLMKRFKGKSNVSREVLLNLLVDNMIMSYDENNGILDEILQIMNELPLLQSFELFLTLPKGENIISRVAKRNNQKLFQQLYKYYQNIVQKLVESQNYSISYLYMPLELWLDYDDVNQWMLDSENIAFWSQFGIQIPLNQIKVSAIKALCNTALVDQELPLMLEAIKNGTGDFNINTIQDEQELKRTGDLLWTKNVNQYSRGKVLFHAIKSGLVLVEGIKYYSCIGYLPNNDKELVLQYIRKVFEDEFWRLEQKIGTLIQFLDPTTAFGKFFYRKRGIRVPALFNSGGTLREVLIMLLNLDNRDSRPQYQDINSTSDAALLTHLIAFLRHWKISEDRISIIVKDYIVKDYPVTSQPNLHGQVSADSKAPTRDGLIVASSSAFFAVSSSSAKSVEQVLKASVSSSSSTSSSSLTSLSGQSNPSISSSSSSSSDLAATISIA